MERLPFHLVVISTYGGVKHNIAVDETRCRGKCLPIGSHRSVGDRYINFGAHQGNLAHDRWDVSFIDDRWRLKELAATWPKYASTAYSTQSISPGLSDDEAAFPGIQRAGLTPRAREDAAQYVAGWHLRSETLPSRSDPSPLRSIRRHCSYMFGEVSFRPVPRKDRNYR